MAKYTATRADDLTDTMGVATHIDYTDGGYANIGQSLKALKYLGVDHLRDASPNPVSDPSGQGHLGDAAAAGMKFVFIAQGNVDPATVVSRLHAFEAAHPGAIAGIEGPNEVNNWPVTYHGLSGTAGAQAYQKDLFAAVNADQLLKNVPVLGFTDYPVHASDSDWNNTHPYPKNGSQPWADIANNKAAQDAVDPGKPFAITEVGYHTSLTADTAGGWEGVDETVQAKLLLNTYMDAALQGSKGTYLYQLLDAYPDPSNNNQETHFGLFRLDYSPKPAATAIHNLTSILDDSGGSASSFQAGSLDYSLSGLPADGHSYLTQKSDGSFQIIAWAEPDIWNEQTDTAIAAPTSSTTISLGQKFATAQIFDPMKGEAAIQTLHDVSSVTISLTDHPLIVQLSGAGDTTTPVTPTPTPPTTSPTQPTTPAVPGAINGGTGNDHLQGTVGSDVINGFDGNDSLYGGNGNDQLNGGNGNDLLHGGSGNDIMTGGAGNDTYIVHDVGDKVVEAANGGTDFVRSGVTYTLPDHVERLELIYSGNTNGFGNAADNRLDGNSGNNELHGGAGADILQGGLGNDRLWGDAGQDTFVFSTKPGTGNVDTIVDFSVADDTIQLARSAFNAFKGTGALQADAFYAGNTNAAHDASDRVIYNAKTGDLFYDADGTGAGKAVQFAHLDPGLHLTASDFWII
ncbi:calcium-binding protein [Aureimonas psammosilenae]|uniref:calcium-binding protein n=1 Tax=Aureimonas psammosilenae TaxID=2495496 RepID=UPI0012606555|nr:calcium-binding protein [Aureimonas psammosilenae]